MRVTVRIKVNVTYLRFSCLLPKNPIPRDKCWVKGKIEEAGSSGEKVDSCLQEPTSLSQSFVQRLYREKRKGLHVEERFAG